MPREGKCTNYAGCLLAYRNEIVEAPEGSFTCPECGQPLKPALSSSSSQRKVIPSLIVGGISALILLGAAAVWLEARKMKQHPPGHGTSFAEAAGAMEWGDFPL